MTFLIAKRLAVLWERDGLCLPIPVARLAIEQLFRAITRPGTIADSLLLIAYYLLLNQRTDIHPQVVRPEQERQHSLPKRQVQEADTKEPGGEPRERRKALILDLDLFHMGIL
jgi:hypothetical protein